MAQKLLTEPPKNIKIKYPDMYPWLISLFKRVSDQLQIIWTQIDLTGSSIADLTVIDHDLLAGLGDDDHTQYHTDTRGDARYYTKTLLDAGQLDTRYYTETELDGGQLNTLYYTETEVNTLLAAKADDADLTAHTGATSAHSATGDIVGTGDTMTTTTAGVANQIASVADLNQTISDPPTQAEVQAISDKVDALLAAMRTANHLQT